MAELEMISWRKGLQTVSLIRAVKHYSTGSLLQAKIRVEHLLAGETVTLAFASDALKAAFKAEAERLGVIFAA